MFKRPVKEISAEFSAEERFLPSIQRTVRESCIVAGLRRKEVSAVLLATEEAATNIIRHAYLYEKGVLRLRIVIYRKLVVLSLIDFGRSFTPDATGTLDLKRLIESGRKGGLGFYMIQKIMDSVEYISSAGRNELRMIKRITSRPIESRPFLRRMSTLRVKFSFWTFMIMAVIIAGSFYYLDRRTSGQLYDRLDETVLALTKTITDQAAGHLLRSRSTTEFDELVLSYTRANPELLQVVLVDSGGLVMAHSDNIRNIRKPYQPPDDVGKVVLGHPFRYVQDGQELNFLAQPIERNDRHLGDAFVVYSSEPISEPLRQARERVIKLTALLLLFGVLGIYMLSNYFVRPIVQITRRVRGFTSGDLESELPLEGAEEFFEISRAFNEMMTRLRQDRENIVAREKMAKEIELASQIQQTLMPTRLPNLSGLDLDAFYRAASIVGGDLYDVFEITPERYCLVVADVSGKGVPASLVMSMLRTVIQISAAGAVSAADTLVKVNEYLCNNMPPGMFITVMLVFYDADERKIDIVSAGHNPMLYYHAQTGHVDRINPSGLPLGVPVLIDGDFGDRLEQVSLTLEADDCFLMYTDGITEASDRQGTQFGLDRLSGLLADRLSAGGSIKAAQVADAIVAQLDDFAGFDKQTDDITFIVARATTGAEVQPGGETADLISVDHPAETTNREWTEGH
ncbi:MAG: SpoIIE family protein phosphatase [candidate division Zixibacteria bacterium]|nr:SpoIIE family protein phosphatase [candidate division Zixibacteria bacterium]MDH3937895.1 SpoIIE family protein phosphatase [candidate division Zixibacteria bacterium]MDH4034065.1 SpoIIE family protein phosphatase [candidate division Zixibacteria bacterium]